VWFTLSALRGVDLKNEVPHIIAQTRLVWNKKSFARFHPHKRHLYEASQQPFQCKLQAWFFRRFVQVTLPRMESQETLRFFLLLGV
jgi:hypothetical protein